MWQQAQNSWENKQQGGNPNLSKQLHQRKRSEASLSDEYETPDSLVAELSKQYGIFPELDAAANRINHKCVRWVVDSLNDDWVSGNLKDDLWLNPPQTKCKEFVLKANEQWCKHNINIMMIIPANVLTTDYFHQVINNVEYYPIFGRITFLYNGKPSPYPARNGYFVVIWRKRI